MNALSSLNTRLVLTGLPGEILSQVLGQHIFSLETSEEIEERAAGSEVAGITPQRRFVELLSCPGVTREMPVVPLRTSTDR